MSFFFGSIVTLIRAKVKDVVAFCSIVRIKSAQVQDMSVFFSQVDIDDS